MSRSSAWLACALVALTGLGACHREDRKPQFSPEQIERIKKEIERRKREKAAKEAHPGAQPMGAPSGEPLEEPIPSASAAEAAPAPPTGPWIVDEAVDLGPITPATATEFGVVVNTKDGEILVSRLGRRAPAPRPSRTPLRAFPPEAGPFGIGRGPSSFEGYVYWISHGSLVRRALSPKGDIGALEVLARDAHDGTRVAVPIVPPGKKLAKIPATVAYVVRPPKEDAPLVAKLWTEGAASEVLTAEGNSTHSVSLVGTDDGVLAVSVQARMAITPVHARRVRFASGKPLIGDDVVVWVGGGIQSLTEMAVLPDGDHDLWGFLPHEKSIQEFGLARLDIGMSPDMDTETTWILYPNGIDPAPVSAGHLCGEPVIFHSAPATRDPDSPQELLVRTVGPGEPSWQRVGSERVVYFTSFAETEGGALAVWVTDSATKAATLRCPPGRK